ncbi:hypothetical protein BLNAU_8999 [Blattamonas nauphoetae]|uniref:Cyclin n=1 Tax=Blattamonas nauphoetae TaxID=2049346 RepID=A0ABQ9XX24_9EUKA|nr:hypothetical protein BLNAU_8999 [Blattamonas nauphoetae]
MSIRSAIRNAQPHELFEAVRVCVEDLVTRNDNVVKDIPNFQQQPLFCCGSASPPFRTYFEKVMMGLSCSPICFVYTLVFIDRLQKSRTLYLTTSTAHKTFLTCSVIAAKYLDDKYFYNSFYASVGMVMLPEFNRMELQMLANLRFNLYIRNTYIEDYFGKVKTRAQQLRNTEEMRLPKSHISHIKSHIPVQLSFSGKSTSTRKQQIDTIRKELREGLVIPPFGSGSSSHHKDVLTSPTQINSTASQDYRMDSRHSLQPIHIKNLNENSSQRLEDTAQTSENTDEKEFEPLSNTDGHSPNTNSTSSKPTPSSKASAALSELSPDNPDSDTPNKVSVASVPQKRVYSQPQLETVVVHEPTAVSGTSSSSFEEEPDSRHKQADERPKSHRMYTPVRVEMCATDGKEERRATEGENTLVRSVPTDSSWEPHITLPFPVPISVPTSVASSLSLSSTGQFPAFSPERRKSTTTSSQSVPNPFELQGETANNSSRGRLLSISSMDSELTLFSEFNFDRQQPHAPAVGPLPPNASNSPVSLAPSFNTGAYSQSIAFPNDHSDSPRSLDVSFERTAPNHDQRVKLFKKGTLLRQTKSVCEPNSSGFQSQPSLNIGEGLFTIDQLPSAFPP